MNTQSAKVIEECSELIHAICKAEKFGWFNWHPEHPTTSNMKDVQHEIANVKNAIHLLELKMKLIIQHKNERTRV